MITKSFTVSQTKNPVSPPERFVYKAQKWSIADEPKESQQKIAERWITTPRTFIEEYARNKKALNFHNLTRIKC